MNEWWQAIPLFFVSWLLAIVAGAFEKGLREERQGVPLADRHGTSVGPTFPVVPLVVSVIWYFGARRLLWNIHLGLLALAIGLIVICMVRGWLFRRSQTREL